jgi:predicted MPP superfamily phosphohydrolase
MAFRITDRTLSIPGWTGRATVAHITDLHFGWVTPTGVLEDAVALVDTLGADVCVLTGDFVGRGARFLPVVTETLAALRTPGVAVLGNHDHYVGASRVSRALERAGIEVLRNRSTRVGGLEIAGMDDSTTGNHDPVATVAGLKGPALGITHNPSSAPALWARGVPVVLSGHTHGGQVHLRGVTAAFHRALGTRYLAGLYRAPAGVVYVNAGLGSTVFPWRIGRPAHREVALMTLVGAR